MRALTVLATCLALAACGGSGGGGSSAPPPATASAPGTIDRFEVVSSVDAYGGATPGGAAGPYTLVTGIVHGKLDPNHADNADIVDLKLAPRGADGMVAYTTDAAILRPKTAAGARRVMLYEVVNRGGKLTVNRHVGGGTNLATGAAPPATFSSVLQRGYTMVWSGWQGNVAQTGQGGTDDLGTRFPIAKNADGTTITGLSREEFIRDNAGNAANIPLKYLPASLTDRSEVQFTARQSWMNPAGLQDYATPSVPVTSWSYVVNADSTVGVAFTPPASVPRFNGPAEPADSGTIYSFVYRAKDPMVMGIGLAAVRDLVQFLKTTGKDGQGNDNPLNDLRTAACAAGTGCAASPAGNFDLVMATGVSQSGRYLRDFVYRGFNKAADGARVFDGIMPLGTGARRTWINYRFAQPDRASKQHEDHFAPGVEFPFTYETRTDIYGGEPDGVMKKCQASGTCPKVMHLDGSMEWWTARGALVVTDGQGRDIALPENVRYYFMASQQHTGSNTGVTTGLTTQPLAGTRCEFASNPVTMSPTERALLPALERWIVAGTLPPASRYPTVTAGTAVASDAISLGWPNLASISVPNGTTTTPLTLNVNYSGIYNQIAVTDYSATVPVRDLNKQYRILLPKVDHIGNEISGIRQPEVQVPIATYAGWNYRRTGFAQGEMCALVGTTLPLAVSAATKAATDPRPTLADLYTGKADYLAKFGAAADALVAQGFLTSVDATNVYKARATAISPLLIPNP